MHVHVSRDHSLIVPSSEQLRRSVAKVLGEFSVREHVFYGAIFLSMTIIVMFCFLLVNRTQSNTSSFLPYQGNLGKLSIE